LKIKEKEKPEEPAPAAIPEIKEEKPEQKKPVAEAKTLLQEKVEPEIKYEEIAEPKIVKECSYPITATRVVKLIVTDLAVIEVTDKGLLRKEVAPGLTAEDVQSVTEPKLIISPDLTEIQF